MSQGFSALSLGILGATAGAAVVSAGIYAVARRRQDAPADGKFARFALGIAVWNALAVVTFLVPGRVPVLAISSVKTVVALGTSILWIEFVIYYTGHGDWLTRGRRALLWLEPAVYTGFEVHQFVVPSARAAETVGYFDGLAYVVPGADPALLAVWVAYPLVVTFASFVLLGEFVLRTRGGYRRQAAALFFASFFVYVGLFVYYTVVAGPVIAFDPMPALNAVMTVVIAVALFRLDFLATSPLSTDVLFEAVPDPVLVVAPDDRIVDANGAAKSLTAGRLEGQALSTAAPALVSALEDPDGMITVDVDGGAERVFDPTVAPLTDPYDRQRGRLVVLRDVTPRIERERELERQNERLERFTSVVSHDLRNPLNVAYGFIQQAKATGDTEPLDRSLSALEDMEDLIDDVLTLAREGKRIDETDRVDVAAVAREAWPFVSEEATLVVESTATIEADRSRLAALLGNCFRNAVEHSSTSPQPHTPEDAVEHSSTSPQSHAQDAREHDGEGVTVWVGTADDGWYVEDDGPGIPEDERETVFDSGYTTSDDGTGLGLSIVATVAEAHGWSVDVETGREGGAKFVFSGMALRDRRPVDATATSGE